MLKVCYVAFSVEMLLLKPIALLLTQCSHIARLLIVSAGMRTLIARQYLDILLL